MRRSFTVGLFATLVGLVCSVIGLVPSSAWIGVDVQLFGLTGGTTYSLWGMQETVPYQSTVQTSYTQWNVPVADTISFCSAGVSPGTTLRSVYRLMTAAQVFAVGSAVALVALLVLGTRYTVKDSSRAQGTSVRRAVAAIALAAFVCLTATVGCVAGLALSCGGSLCNTYSSDETREACNETPKRGLWLAGVSWLAVIVASKGLVGPPAKASIDSTGGDGELASQVPLSSSAPL